MRRPRGTESMSTAEVSGQAVKKQISRRDLVEAMGTRPFAEDDRVRPIVERARPLVPPTESGPTRAEQIGPAESEQAQTARKQNGEYMAGKKWADITNPELILVDELIAEKRRAGQGILEGEKPPAPRAEAVAPKPEPVPVVETPKPAEAPAAVPKTEQAPMNWDLQPRKHLPAVQRAVESSVNTRVQADPKRYINAYQQSFGRANEYNADLAAELFRDYRDNRTANRPAVASASSKIAYEALLDRLEKEPASATPELMLTAGGTGSGKSTVTKNIARHGVLTYDSTLAGSLDGAVRLVEKALATGRSVEVAYVYREPVDAFQATLRRAREEGAGRVVDLDTHVGTHTNAPKNVTALIEKYSGDPRVTFNFSEMGPDGVKPGNAAILQKGVYDGLRERLADVLEQERKDGRISADIYHAIRGRDLQGEVPPPMAGSPGGGQLLRDAPGGDVPGLPASRPPQAQSGHPTGSVDALTRAETAARERLSSACKGETISAKLRNAAHEER